MKRHGTLAFFISIAILFSSVPPAHAAITSTQALAMSQGTFALAIIKEAGALSRLSPGASGQDAVDFLSSLGIIPEDGWDVSKPVDEAFLRSLVQNSPEGATLDEIIQSIVTSLESAILLQATEQNVNSGSAGPSS